MAQHSPPADRVQSYRTAILTRETAGVVNDREPEPVFFSPVRWSDGEEDYVFEGVRHLLIPVLTYFIS